MASNTPGNDDSMSNRRDTASSRIRLRWPDDAEDNTRAEPDRDAPEPDQERIARAEDGPCEHVAAEPIGAEQMRPARRLQAFAEITDQRVKVGKQRGRNRRCDQERDKDNAQNEPKAWSTTIKDPGR